LEVWQSPVYCNSLENCRVERHREFESHRFRQNMHKYQSGLMAQSAKLSIREFESHLVFQSFNARVVYRLGHRPFTAGRGVRFSLGVPFV
jgi:hypothetical protein